MICGFCVTLFFCVCFVCLLKIFMPRVLFLQSLTLGTSMLSCGLFEQVACPGGGHVIEASGGVTAVAMSWMQVDGSCFVSAGSAHIIVDNDGVVVAATLLMQVGVVVSLSTTVVGWW